MKIKVKEISYNEFKNLKCYKRKKPLRQSSILRYLIRLLSKGELKSVNFKYTLENSKLINSKTPSLILMNHSCFLDLKMAFTILKKKKFNIVMTDDGFIGKENLMRHVGCIPTMKFVTDLSLVKDLIYTTKTLKQSILMYPEASYSFDGCATALPYQIGKLVKKLGIDVVMFKTTNAFLHDPLYNELKLRNVDVSLNSKTLITKDEIKEITVEEINERINKEFMFDAFSEQIKSNTLIKENFRAEGLNRILYKCIKCGKEHNLISYGNTLKCNSCGEEYTLEENGILKAKDFDLEFNTISSWNRYQRNEVKKEIVSGSYHMEFDCDIYGMKDFKAIYKLGKGHLSHTVDGFVLKGNDIDLEYKQSINHSYSLYSDFFWYEIDDIICIGDSHARYYLVPKLKDCVNKIRIAQEEIYKIKVKNER